MKKPQKATNQFKDLTGRVFGDLVVVEAKDPMRRNSYAGGLWVCRCKCGKFVNFYASALIKGNNKTCGCINFRQPNLTGRTFGLLTVIRQVRKNEFKGKAKSSTSIWNFVCKCSCKSGRVIVAYGSELLRGNIKSCGCLKLKYETNFARMAARNYSAAKRRHSRRFPKETMVSLEEYTALCGGRCDYCGSPPEDRTESMKRLVIFFEKITGDKEKSVVLDRSKRDIHVYTNGVDRVNSRKGYTKENCVPCCSACNTMKMGLSKGDFLLRVDKIKKYQNRLNRKRVSKK